MTLNGHVKDILVDPSGSVVLVEEEVPLASLPAAARAAVQKAVGKGKLLRAESVTEKGALLYEA